MFCAFRCRSVLRVVVRLSVLGLSLLCTSLRAETGYEAWLRYAPLEKSAAHDYSSLPASVVVPKSSDILTAAQGELIRGVRGMIGKTLRASGARIEEPAVVLVTLDGLRALVPNLDRGPALTSDGFSITPAVIHNFQCLVITSPSDRGILYGVFALLSGMARHESLSRLYGARQPSAPIRWVDQWDNLDGSVERGYGGRSIFFDNGSVRADLTRVRDYARLLASVGINGCSINNVNANPHVLEMNFLPQLARVADVFRPWGVRMTIAVDLGSPKLIGGLDTFDPLDPRVADWWQKKFDEIYQLIPDLGGVVVKADSEGRAGPSTYNRTPADAANVIARALKPHSGIVFYRAFVYNHHLDWRNPKNDRARAAYDIFHPLDGKFDDNVVIQIKHGPIDFQTREPVSPLIAGLEHTNEVIELQITQEYTGQGRHLCFLPSMWAEVLDFDFHADSHSEFPANYSPVKEIISGKTFHRPTGGFVGIANVGLDTTWLGHPLSMANLYGFGRLAWDPNLDPTNIAAEWTRLTFGNNPVVVDTLTPMLRNSWRVYESYTGPLGAQTLTDITGSHYGPNIESSEENGWGQWHRADHLGIGMDRSVATGTGFAGQYPPEVAKIYESASTTPDNLLLFFHHVPYTYKLVSGETVIQYIYDSHYSGAKIAASYVDKWKTLQGHIDDERYADVLRRLNYLAGHAIVWRDAICTYFLNLSGIPDTHGHAGNFPDRIEAESMDLQGYVPVAVTPRENASGGKAIECTQTQGCAASFKFTRAPGWYELDVEYFDQNNGESKFRVLVNDQIVDEWLADDHLPATKIGGDSSTRRRIPGLALRPGDQIRIEGIPDRDEDAPLDYVELQASAE
jgi:alpha-glucuronidase